MQIAKELAGFTGAKADDLRKAIGKKNRAGDGRSSSRSSSRAAAPSGTRRDVIDWLWTTNEKSADYSFNKSHAACYALIAYRTAWLKANYPAEYMAALISSVMDTKDKVPFFAAQARGDGHRDPAARRQPLRPRVRRRRRQHPLRARRGQGRRLRGGRGDQGARARRAARSSRSGTSARASTPRAVNKQAIEALIKCGAFGSTGATRKGMLGVLEQAQAAGQQAQLDAQIGQGSIFDLGDLGGGDDGAAVAVRGAAAPADPARGVRAGRAAGDREGVDRALHLRAPAQGGARGAARARRRPAGRAAPSARTATGSRPAGIITQAKKIRTQEGRPDDVRHARRPRGLGRGPDLRQGARRVRGRARRRRGRARARPRRPRATRAPRSSRRPSSPSGRRAEEVEAAREAAALEPQGPQPLTRARRRHARCRRRSSTSSSTSSATTPASPRSCWRSQTSAGPRTLRLGRGLPRQRRRRACAPSWAASSARRRSRSAERRSPGRSIRCVRRRLSRPIGFLRRKGVEDRAFFLCRSATIASHAGALLRYVRASDPSLYRWTGGGGSPLVCLRAAVHRRAPAGPGAEGRGLLVYPQRPPA